MIWSSQVRGGGGLAQRQHSSGWDSLAAVRMEGVSCAAACLSGSLEGSQCGLQFVSVMDMP
jgi:hypothetical protein